MRWQGTFSQNWSAQEVRMISPDQVVRRHLATDGEIENLNLDTRQREDAPSLLLLCVCLLQGWGSSVTAGHNPLSRPNNDVICIFAV